MILSEMTPKRFKLNFIGEKMIRRYKKNSMISNPMITTVRKNKAKRNQEPPSKTVSSYFKSLKY
jgi:hypothetical protein